MGGVKEKSIGALRAGIHKIILPEENRKDLEDIPQEVLDVVDFTFVTRIEQVLDIMFASPGTDLPGTKKKSTVKKSTVKTSSGKAKKTAKETAVKKKTILPAAEKKKTAVKKSVKEKGSKKK
ncbi:MAG: hypothetical protein J6S53_05690 [Lentisphaeria bacterium]|nr:hypothetical protein [Lentisphaeria bacterium]